jgi:hypothetical protein
MRTERFALHLNDAPILVNLDRTDVVLLIDRLERLIKIHEGSTFILSSEDTIEIETYSQYSDKGHTMSKHTIGCIFTHHTSGCETEIGLSDKILEFAKSFGFEEGTHVPPCDRASADDDILWMDQESEEAINHLNSLDLPPYTNYAKRGKRGFGLWPLTGQVRDDDGAYLTVVYNLSATEFIAHINVNRHHELTLYSVKLEKVWSSSLNHTK